MTGGIEMRIFMLGWEFPPYITGGLGTACYGLTKALSRNQIQVTFVLPKGVGTDYSSHVKLLSPQARRAAAASGRSSQGQANTYVLDKDQTAGEFAGVTFKTVPSRLMFSPYQSTGGRLQTGGVAGSVPIAGEPAAGMADAGDGDMGSADTSYDGDVMSESRRYAELCVDLARNERFDVIHAHDWMTFPAGLAVSAAMSKPLVVHVHSTEFDRAGERIHHGVYDVERRGMHGAMRVIAVSHMTKSIIQHRYGVDSKKIDVVYNGIDNDGRSAAAAEPRTTISKADKIVLFLGRVTMQKGPEYFIEAAKKVLEKYDKVKFVVAGSGDKVQEVIDLAAAHGIGHKVLFTGFLHGEDVERVFKMADVYVMPSVSEPFGIAPLEAISHDVPVIISKTSGVSEVLKHALKVDFWDINEIANKIIAVLKHPPLSTTLREHADLEVRRLTWDGAATQCRHIYENAMAAMSF